MKRRLNLFTNRAQTTQLSLVYAKVKKIALLTGAGVLSALLIFGGVYFFLERQLTSAKSSYATYNRYILLNKSFSQQIQEFVFKHQLMKSYVEGDAESFQYYQVLTGIFAKTSPAETLTQFSLDNKRNTTFTVSFRDYESALKFVDEIENPDYTKHFEKLTIDTFGVIEQDQESYDLALEGIFTSIHNDQPQQN